MLVGGGDRTGLKPAGVRCGGGGAGSGAGRSLRRLRSRWLWRPSSLESGDGSAGRKSYTRCE